MSVFPGGEATSIRSSRISINGDALKHNINRAKTLASNSKVMAVVKADAYGHGVETVIDHLSEADGYALAMTGEAVELRNANIDKPLTVLQGFANEDELNFMFEHDLQPVIHQDWQIDMLERYSQKYSPGKKIAVWLKADTGMHRLGLLKNDFLGAYRRIQDCSTVGAVRIMSHFANADVPGDAYNNHQLDMFNALLQKLDNKHEASLANSAALMSSEKSHFDWVRPGIMLYGSSPLTGKTVDELDLVPVMTFESRLCAVNLLKKNDVVGYGSTWKCPDDMPVGVVAAGYADGYPRSARPGTPVWINGKLCPIVGRVSMDSLCVDLRGIQARAGDKAVLWGAELSVDVVASHAATIGYELLCQAGNAGVNYKK